MKIVHDHALNEKENILFHNNNKSYLELQKKDGNFESGLSADVFIPSMTLRIVPLAQQHLYVKRLTEISFSSSTIISLFRSQKTLFIFC